MRLPCDIDKFIVLNDPPVRLLKPPPEDPNDASAKKGKAGKKGKKGKAVPLTPAVDLAVMHASGCIALLTALVRRWMWPLGVYAYGWNIMIRFLTLLSNFNLLQGGAG
jgi:hypothetical protein